jgi:hypothetical protein
MRSGLSRVGPSRNRSESSSDELARAFGRPRGSFSRCEVLIQGHPSVDNTPVFALGFRLQRVDDKNGA